ncbi:unnamed protein product [Soboliphyme baturini]|uniref:Sel1 repeat family protein n=1 Tax=Soboliphyme baturini TaxID=241478 RepID=A0A183ISW2_9BILA|nr:unnamed protein product [Soboliphyme baturini]
MAFIDFKKAEEVQEYLKNLHTEYMFSCNSEKNAEGCHLLGDYTEAILNNPEEAYALYKENCNLRQHPKSCYKYGRYLLRGKFEKIDEDRVYDLMTLACDKDWYIACPELALLLLKGTKKHAVDVPRAFELLEKSCEAEIVESCFWLDKKFTSGYREIKPNFEKAFKFAMKSCLLGLPQGCDSVSRHYEHGEGIQKDEEKARQYADLAAQIREEMRKSIPTGLSG